MRAAGVKRVVTTCAESYHVMAFHYRRVVPGFSLDVEHFTTFLERELAGRDVEFHPVPGRVTYHDPCRLGRMSGVVDAPRRLLARIPGLELAEMRHHGSKALCCGTSAWVRCGATNKAIQLARLDEAAATGSAALATACPKCVIHLRCAQADLPAGPAQGPAPRRHHGTAGALPRAAGRSDDDPDSGGVARRGGLQRRSEARTMEVRSDRTPQRTTDHEGDVS